MARVAISLPSSSLSSSHILLGSTASCTSWSTEEKPGSNHDMARSLRAPRVCSHYTANPSASSKCHGHRAKQTHSVICWVISPSSPKHFWPQFLHLQPPDFKSFKLRMKEDIFLPFRWSSEKLQHNHRWVITCIWDNDTYWVQLGLREMHNQLAGYMYTEPAVKLIEPVHIVIGGLLRYKLSTPLFIHVHFNFQTQK